MQLQTPHFSNVSSVETSETPWSNSCAAWHWSFSACWPLRRRSRRRASQPRKPLVGKPTFVPSVEKRTIAWSQSVSLKSLRFRRPRPWRPASRHRSRRARNWFSRTRVSSRQPRHWPVEVLRSPPAQASVPAAESSMCWPTSMPSVGGEEYPF